MWPMFYAPTRGIQVAQSLREARDRIYSDLYYVEDTDLRWAGDLAELMVSEHLQHQLGPTVTWHNELNAAGKPDITVGDVRIGVKCVKRSVCMRPSYSAQISARHKAEDVDFFLFTSYWYPRRLLYVLGLIEPARFLRHAKYYGPGEWVHPAYQVRDGHGIYNAPVKPLVDYWDWLGSMGARVPCTAAAA